MERGVPLHQGSPCPGQISQCAGEDLRAYYPGDAVKTEGPAILSVLSHEGEGIQDRIDHDHCSRCFPACRGGCR